MQAFFEQRPRTVLGACVGSALLVLATGQLWALAQDNFVFNGEASFVMSHIECALSQDAG